MHGSTLKESRLKNEEETMFAVIYQAYLKANQETTYRQAWQTIASYFISHKGSLGSTLHRTEDNLWVAYSRWPSKQARDAAWPGKNDPSPHLPPHIQQAIATLRDCIETSLPEICMETVYDLS